MKKALSNNYFVVLFSILIFFSIVWVGAFSQAVLSLVAATMYCAVTVILLESRNTPRGRLIVLGILIAPFVLLLGPIHLLTFNATLVSLPSFLCYFLGVIFGILIFFSSKMYKFGFSALLLAFGLFMCFKGYSIWLNKLNFGTYLSVISDPLPNVTFKDDKGKLVELANVRDKAIVLDFWDTGCGICFSKFPITQAKNQAYFQNSKVQFYAVNIPVKRDSIGQGTSVFRSLKYTFTNLNVDSFEAAKKYGVNYVPTVVIIYNKRIVYRGDIENIDKCLDSL